MPRKVTPAVVASSLTHTCLSVSKSQSQSQIQGGHVAETQVGMKFRHSRSGVSDGRGDRFDGQLLDQCLFVDGPIARPTAWGFLETCLDASTDL
jgi:hypothetical protein